MMSIAAIRRAGAPHEIATLGAFREYMAGGRGVIVIADGDTAPAERSHAEL
jgi:hypothetical protein